MKYFGIIFLYLVLLISCIEKKSSLYREYKNTLRYPLGGEPPTLDWNRSSDTTSSLVIQNIMEGLTEYDFSSGKVSVKGALAERWKSSADKKHWIFYLKPHLKWHDGEPLTAGHFIDSWERLLNPETGSEYAQFLFPVKNARAYNSRQISDFSKVGLKAGSKGKIIIHLEKGISYLPYLFTHTSTFPIRKALTKKNNWTEPENIVTLGPYRLTRWDHDKALVLEAAESYYGPPPNIKKVILYVIPEETTALHLFFSGRLDVLTNLPSRELPFLKKKPEYRSHDVMSLYYYGFNVNSPPLNDVRVRKAIAHGINRKEIALILNESRKPLSSWIPPGLFGYNKTIGLKFDPVLASRFLDEAGYKDRSRFPRLKLSYNTNADHKMIAENVQAQLRKNLKINIELDNQEWKTYLRKLSLEQTQIFRLGWVADYPDPDNFMNLMASFSENNHTGWGHREFDSLVLKAMVVSNGSRRKALYDSAQKILLEKEVPVLPLFSGRSHMLVSSRVKHYPLNVMSYVLFKTIQLEDF